MKSPPTDVDRHVESEQKNITLSALPGLPFLGGLLFLSGACALVYQMAWLREFRLVFGGATPSTAAVLAIFMGGLGLGSALFGRRAESAANPLRLYGLIEMGVGVSALLTPLLLGIVRALYLGTGGITALGLWPAILLQLLLATVVLASPCLLMGGSLPAAFKWAETDQDRQRGALGVLYGVNTLGALVGVVASTFWLLEHWGIRGTVWAAAVVNLLIGAAAWAVARHGGAVAATHPPPPSPPAPRLRAANPSPAAKARKAAIPQPEVAAPVAVIASKAPPWFVYLAAGITGFTFFLCELVWFRMLAPLLGSSVYGFGLILALALAGIGVGGLLYRQGWAARAGAVSLGALALVAAWQALLLAAPYALGDRLAVLAADLSQLRAFGLPGQIIGWTLVTSLLVVGPALLAGVQFPMLVGLLGEGTRNAARHVGYAYAANTLGAILGSLAGGFVLLPMLSAPGCWRLAVVLTLLLSLGAALLAARSAPRRVWPAVAALWLCGSWLIAVPAGPTAAWRHQPIGYGRVEAPPASPNGLREWLYAGRRSVVDEFEGREASVATLIHDRGYVFYVNGKADGSAFGDAHTQVMLGLLPAMLHPGPKNAFVVGLGTGSTAGWLADVPGMERVDVAELEPGMTRLARDYFAPVNRDVMTKPNARLIIGDAREALLAAGPGYDLIVSEPSNPYRTGIAALFTQEFYEAVKGRLAPGGLFAQWLQCYEVDSRAVRLVYATLAAAFPYVETWVTNPQDLLFIGHLAPPAYPLEHLRTRVAQPPFAEAMRRVWYTRSAEGLLARHLASPEVTLRIASKDAIPNTDDRNQLEYGFARALARESKFDMGQVLSIARAMKAEVPAHLSDQVDHIRLEQERLLMLAANDTRFSLTSRLQGDDRRRAEAVAAFVEKRYPEVLSKWVGEAAQPHGAVAAPGSRGHGGHARPGAAAPWPGRSGLAGRRPLRGCPDRRSARRAGQRAGAPAGGLHGTATAGLGAAPGGSRGTVPGGAPRGRQARQSPVLSGPSARALSRRNGGARPVERATGDRPPPAGSAAGRGVRDGRAPSPVDPRIPGTSPERLSAGGGPSHRACRAGPA